MKRNWYLIAGVIAIALLFFLKYDYDQREKEKARVEKLNNDVRNAAESGKERFDEAFRPIGDGLFGDKKTIDINHPGK